MKRKQKRAYDKWLDYWKLRVNWEATPEAREAWNGAIDTVCDGVYENLLVYFEDFPMEDAQKFVKELRDKYKEKI